MFIIIAAKLFSTLVTAAVMYVTRRTGSELF